jgi:hypothetical protein
MTWATVCRQVYNALQSSFISIYSELLTKLNAVAGYVTCALNPEALTSKVPLRSNINRLLCPLVSLFLYMSFQIQYRIESRTLTAKVIDDSRQNLHHHLCKRQRQYLPNACNAFGGWDQYINSAIEDLFTIGVLFTNGRSGLEFEHEKHPCQLLKWPCRNLRDLAEMRNWVH